MFFTIKLSILVKLNTYYNTPVRSYTLPDYPLLTLYFALYTMRVPCMTKEIRATWDFKLHPCTWAAAR